MRPALALWSITGVALALLARLSRERLGGVAFAIEAMWLLAGVVLLGVAIWRARKLDDRGRHLLTVAVLVLGALCYVPMARLGDAITVKLRFSAHRDAYAQIVAREQGDPSGEGVHERAGERYFVDAGPPLRIAFIWPGGAIDNWCGAVYDPSGVVVAPLSERTDLFGGDPFFCEELEAPYYQCCFT